MIINKLSINNNIFLYTECKYKKNIKPNIICSDKSETSSDGIFFYKKSKGNNIYVELFNKDGSKANFCGNGLLGLSQLILENNQASNVYFNHKKYLIIKEKNENYLMIPNLIYFKDLGNNLYLINVGNTHLLRIIKEFTQSIFNNDIKEYPNCNISQVIIDNKFKIKTYERGVGYTSSCGSAAISFYYLLKYLNIYLTKYDIISRGGKTKIVLKEDMMFLNSYVKTIRTYEN
ncbi:MAG: hypothetical protein ACI311_07510 [Bacilli bacterium]